jgi:adenylate kinase
MRIAITGVPGTGKSTFARHLANTLHYPLYSLSSLIPHITHKTYNKEWQAWEVDVKEIERWIGNLQPPYIVEGHLLSEINAEFDIVIVMRCPLPILVKRLKDRGYSNKKVEENVVAEWLDYCGQKHEKVFYIDGSKPVNTNVNHFMRWFNDSYKNDANSKGQKL